MNLADLIAEVEKLDGPSREVDARIVAFLNRAMVKPYPPTDDFGPRDSWQFWTLDGAHFIGSERKFPVPLLTASIDAVVALIERELPGWDVVTQSRDGKGTVVLAEPKDGKPWGECIKADSDAISRPMPIAYCLAFLRARAARAVG